MNTEKKGLHPLAWVAIGCGALIVIVVLVLTVGFGYLGFKAKEAFEEYEKNPALTTAKLIAMGNSEIEIDSSDEEAETVTFRNVETGELFTVNYKDLEEGRVSFEGSDGGSIEIDSNDAEGSGTITMRDDTGETVLKGGSGGEADAPPAWVPRMSGDVLNGSYTTSTADSESGTYQLSFPDTAVADVLDSYESSLEAEGFEVERSEQSVNGLQSGTVRGEHEEEGRSVTIIVGQNEEGSVEGVLAVTAKKSNG